METTGIGVAVARALRPMWFKTRHIHNHLEIFQGDLAHIGATIQQRNTTRLFPYPYFIPSAVPQRINI
ncbi:hypothetical protein ACLEPN_00870 [Myxococcus sp. 1LA]